MQEVEQNGHKLVYHVQRNRSGHVVLLGYFNHEERLRCDMTTTFNKHPDRFRDECKQVALNRLSQILQGSD